VQRRISFVVGYLLVFGGLAVAVPAAFFVALGLAMGGISNQIAPLAGGLALSALGLAEVYLTDRVRRAKG
jgi:hypothetical protein